MVTMLRRILGCCLAALVGCAPVQQIQPPAQAVAPVAPTVSHVAASGCVGDHDSLNFGPSGFTIDAYPAWPPNGTPDHLVIHYSNGDTIWGKPSYGAANCQDYEHCQRATFMMNPTWNKCVAVGQLLEVVTLDGMPVLESSLLQITDTQTSRTVYLGLSRGTWYAGPSVTAVASQAQQAVSQTSQSPSPTPASGDEHPYLKAGVQVVTGTLAAVLVLGMAYLDYRAQVQSSYNANNISCTSSEMGNSWYTNCH
jgi:hypothetical protein